MKKILVFVGGHKLVVLIILIILGVGGYYGYQKFFTKSATTRYITAKVERGALITSLSGTGQVSASSQVDLKTKTSGVTSPP